MELPERLIVAADFEIDSDGRAGVRRKVMSLAKELQGTGVIIKVNSALRACGYDLIDELNDFGVKVFADLKLVDISKTMEFDGKLLAEAKPAIVTAMANAGVSGLSDLKSALPETEVLAVTVLTSLKDEESMRIFGVNAAQGVQRFSRIAQEAGVDGLILSPKEVSLVRDMPDVFLDLNAPGIRPAWSCVEGDDQSRIATPASAIKSGVRRVVIGRPITQSSNPRRAVEETLEEISEALSDVA